MQVSILTVSELTQEIKKQLEGRFPYVAVRGELSNCKAQSSGHLYFTLKDQEAQIAAVLFRGSLSSLSRPPKEGDQVIVKGEVSLYAPRGQYQLIARHIEYVGVGQLLQKLHELKLKLQERGWFDAQRKQKLPKFPKTIGVVTSPTGAVIQDILHILKRRLGSFHLILNPVRVQGEEAAGEIAQAIKDFDKHCLADLLIVGRGGGSLEDLWPFNEESVAEAIFHCRIPIVSAVGHETDFCIADFVADLRAPTPSAAAEIVSVEKKGLRLELAKTSLRLSQAIYSQLRLQKKGLATLLKTSLLSSSQTLLSTYYQKIDESKNDGDEAIAQFLLQWRLKLERTVHQYELLDPRKQIAEARRRLRYYQNAVTLAFTQLVKTKKEKVGQLLSHLNATHPHHLLKKGYAIVFREKEGSVILSSKEIEVKERLRIQLGQGELIAEVVNKV